MSTTPSTASAPQGAVWRHEIDDDVDLRIGHNDIGPQNTVFASGLPYGFIDWELAGPRPPLYDIAYAAVNFTPLRPDQFCRMVGFDEPPDRGRRLRLFCDAYGLEDRSSLLEAMERFERDDLRVMVEGGRAGASPHSRYLARGEDRFLRYAWTSSSPTAANWKTRSADGALIRGRPRWFARGC